MVRESERAFRANWKPCTRLEMAVNPFMRERRKAAYPKRRRVRELRAFQALNVMGVRIWANKPRLFGGMKWRARRATVARSIELEQFRESRAWQRRGEAAFTEWRQCHLWGIGQLCVTGAAFAFWDVAGGPIDAPDYIAAGSFWNLSIQSNPWARDSSAIVRAGWKS